MKTKTAYRPKPQAEIIPQPDGPANIEPETEPIIRAEAKTDAPVLDPKPAEPEESEATKRLKQQLADLNYSAELNQRAAHMPQQIPLTREQKLDLWRQQGMADDQAEFLRAHPALIDHHELAAYAANEAAQAGHERGSQEHMRATKDLFDRHMERLKQQAAANSDHQSTPGFFRPEPSLVPHRAVRNNAAIVSAPVSRNGGPSGDYGAAFPSDPSKVRLSRDEVEAAKLSGISATEYARKKLRMLEAKSRGEIV